MFRKSKVLWALVLSISLVLQCLPAVALASVPRVVIEQLTISDSTISKGDRFTVTFNLHNMAQETLRSFYISVPSADFSVINKGSTFMVAKELLADHSTKVTFDLECHSTVSNRIPIEIHFEDCGNIPYKVEEQLLVTFDEETTTQNTPRFILSSTSIPSIGLGETKTISVSIKNNSDYQADKVVIRPVLTGEYLTALSLNQVNLAPSDVTLMPKGEMTFTYDITTNGTATPGIYPITYEIQGENQKKQVFTTLLNGYIKINSDESYGDILVSKINASPKVLMRNQSFELKIQLSNEKKQELQDLKVWVEGLPIQSFIYQEEQLKKTPEISGDDSYFVSFQYMVSEQTPEGNYPYDVHIAYTDAKGNAIHRKESYSLYIGAEQQEKGSLKVQKVKLPTEAVAPNKAFPVSLELSNSGVKSLEDVVVAFTGTEILSKSASTISLGRLEPGESKKVEYTLIASSAPEERNLPISFVITYDEKEGQGTELKTINQNFGIKVAEDTEVNTQPKIILSDLLLPEQVILGEEFELKFVLTNTNSTKAIRNMKVTMSSKDPVSQASNIVLVGQSDSIYVEKLGVGEQASASVSLLIPNTYQYGVCDMDFNFSFEDEKGNVYSDKETIHIPVTSNISLTASNVKISNVRDEGYTLEVDFYNTGKGALKNLMVDLEGDFEATNSNYYVGDLQAGRMDIYSVSINGEIPEVISGSVVFTYEDNGGKKNEMKVPFELHYTKPAADEAVTGEDSNKNTKVASFPYGLVIIAGAVIFIVVTIIRKKRKAM